MQAMQDADAPAFDDTAGGDADAADDTLYAAADTPITPELKDDVAAEVQHQIAFESAIVSGQAQPTVGEFPGSLKPGRVFVVANAIDVSTPDDHVCSLTPGDVLRFNAAAEDSGTADLRVASSHRQDCPAGIAVTLSLADLQEMVNTLRAQLDAGLAELHADQGQGGLPSAPPSSMGAGQASEFAAQPADSSVGALIDAQRQEALNAETPRRRRRFRTNSEEVMLRTCVMFVLAVTCAAQDVPPPPRPVDAAPSPDSAAKFLQDKLGSIGRVSYNLTTHNTKTGATTGPVQAFEEITCILIAPRTCELKVQWDSNAGNSGGTFFLEEMGNAEVLTSQDFLIRSQPGVENTVSPTVYSVSLLSMGDFKVRDQPAANQIANALRQVVQQCKTLPPAAASGPGLEETLSFIEDKLNQQGAVNWLSTVSDTVKGTSGSPIQMSVTVAGVTGDPRSCRLTYHWTKVAGGKNSGDSTYALTLRRVEKLSVMTMEQANNAQHAREGHPELVETLSPALYELVINGAANRAWYFPFTDQDVSNRVAKAILHAVELCGGGKEPF